MPAQQLKLLLVKGALISTNLQDAALLCDNWYAAEPSLMTFILRSIFRDLVLRGWDDPQGVPTAHYQTFQSLVLPHLNSVVGVLAATPSAEPISELDALVVAYRDFLSATP